MKKQNAVKVTVANIFAPAPKAKENPIATLFQHRPGLEPDVELPAYMALTMLTNSCGNVEAVCMLMSRVKLGRMAAYLFFEDKVARKLHLILQSFFAWTSTLRDEDTNIKIPPNMLAKVTDAFAITREMMAKMPTHEIQMLMMKFMEQESAYLTNEDHDYLETCDWDDYKYFWDMKESPKILVEAID